MKRICRKCGVEKDLDEFQKAKTCKYGRCHVCEECGRKTSQDYYCRNRDAILKWQREYNKKNKEHVRATQRENHKKSRRLRNKMSREYNRKNKDRINAKRCENRKKNMANLTDAYIKKAIIGSDHDILVADITPEMIELKRDQLKIRRELKKLKGAINGTTGARNQRDQGNEQRLHVG